MTSNLLPFQQYQLAFTAYIRDPKKQSRPKNTDPVGIAVYKEIVFTNLFDAVSACFPVAQKVLGKRAWLRLVQSFLRNHSANSPLFRQIPEEFLSFLAQKSCSETQVLPDYLFSLCHYEWVELAVSSSNNTLDLTLVNVELGVLNDEALNRKLVFVPSMQLLSYDYAVQTISPQKKPKHPISTQLLAYRNSADIVKFVELNPVTFRLLSLLSGGEVNEALTINQTLLKIAEELHRPDQSSIISFGLEILEDLRSQEVVLGVYL